MLAIWLVTGLLTAGLISLVRELTHDTPASTLHAVSPSGSLSRRDPTPWARWTVTEQLSAHHVLIVHVETRYLDEARAIASQIAAPVHGRYAEILVYVHRPGRPDPVAPRRVQWTPERGYVESSYE
ncbi:MAG: hypothetical protein LC791_07725 [Acidobacteria bacterium]|nr:hypothetical protein [Acidobacteriota bacterium]